MNIDIQPLVMNKDENLNSLGTVKQDSFELYLNYPDPFLKKKSSQIKVIARKVIQPKNDFTGIKNKKVRLSVVFPEIQYIGNMINSSRNKIKAIVLIDQKEFVVSVGDKIGEVVIIEISEQSVKVNKQNVSKTFKINSNN